MHFGVALHLLWAAIVLSVRANPGEEFLNSIIAQLKHQQPSDQYRRFYDELFRATSRSSNEYKIDETEESSDNSVYPQTNNEFDYNQNQQEQHFLQQQFNQIQNQANFAAGNELNPHLVNIQPNLQLAAEQQPTPQIIGLQQFNVNGYLNLPLEGLQPQQGLSPLDGLQQQHGSPHSDGLQQQHAVPFEPTTLAPLNPFENTGPNLFNPVDESHLQLAYGALGLNNQQFLLPNVQNDQQLLLPNVQNDQQLLLPDALNNASPHEGIGNQFVPTYYYYNPDNTVDDNLLDNTIDAMRPLHPGENLIDPNKKYVVEPLFVAMAGFVGIAVIFMSAVLFLPKILTPAPEVSSLKGPQELAALTKLAVEAIEGNDCTERIACEVGRAMRSMQVGSKPIKVLEVLLPAHIAKQLAQIRRAVSNKQICRLIQCKPLKGEKKQPKTGEVEAKIAVKAGKKPSSESESLEPRIKPEKKEHSTQKPNGEKKTTEPLANKKQTRATEKTTATNS